MLEDYVYNGNEADRCCKYYRKKQNNCNGEEDGRVEPENFRNILQPVFVTTDIKIMTKTKIVWHILLKISAWMILSNWNDFYDRLWLNY